MRKISILILLLCVLVSTASAQRIIRNYHDRSMSDVLIDLGKASDCYKVSFIYNELEDFTITQNIHTDNLPDAIRKVISYYPMQMTVGGGFEREVVSNSFGRHCYWWSPFKYSVSFRKGAWGASYQGNIPSKMVFLDNRKSDEAKSEFSAFYQKGAWRFTVEGMWIFAPAKYESETFDNPILKQTEQHVIDNNRRMIVLGISYNFFSGKKKNIRKNINNYDSDAGAF